MKHGVMMIVHNNVESVRACMEMLDDRRFTFYLHIDKKSNYLAEDFIPLLKNAKYHIIDSTSVNWGGYSFVNVFFRLFEAAVKGNEDIIHCCQGADLPLKTADEIDAFAEKHKGKNFLRFQPSCNEFARYKVLCKHFFVENTKYRNSKLLHYLNHGIAHLQKPFMDKTQKFYHGSSLFSLDKTFVEYVLQHEEEIKKQYRYSIAGDEVFVHTLFMHSPFVNTLYEKNNGARMIDWERREGSSPHTFTMEDREMLLKAIDEEDCLFARKFSAERDSEVIGFVKNAVLNKLTEKGTQG